jgi:hypothetical protein
MYGDDLTKMMNECQVAAATLGLHRNENTVGSVLKVREYCARGIPFVYGYDDSCLNGDETFALKVESNDNPIDIDKVVQWVNEISNGQSIALQMRDFAKEKLVGKPYSLLSGFGIKKAPDCESKNFSLHCSYLAWYAWNNFGVDLDSDGGRLATTYDILHSDKVEIVQLYGLNPNDFI